MKKIRFSMQLIVLVTVAAALLVLGACSSSSTTTPIKTLPPVTTTTPAVTQTTTTTSSTTTTAPATTTTTAPVTTTTVAPTTPPPSPTSTPTTPSPSTTQTAVTINLVASGLAFDLSTITVPAAALVTMNFDNKDSVPHNFALYTNSSASPPAIFQGQIISGTKITYTFTAPSTPGTYFFRCDVHPTIMTGSFIVQ